MAERFCGSLGIPSLEANFVAQSATEIGSPASRRPPRRLGTCLCHSWPLLPWTTTALPYEADHRDLPRL
jgi:hypothetical protein